MTTRLPDLTELAAADVAQDDLLLIRDASAGDDKKVEFGSIVERDSNANGEFVRFADGTLMVFVSMDFDATTTDSQTVNSPASFLEGTPKFASFSGSSSSVTVAQDLSDVYVIVSDSTASTIIVRKGSSGSTSSIDLRITVVGRWK